jgi:hypothetical protein
MSVAQLLRRRFVSIWAGDRARLCGARQYGCHVSRTAPSAQAAGMRTLGDLPVLVHPDRVRHSDIPGVGHRARPLAR